MKALWRVSGIWDVIGLVIAAGNLPLKEQPALNLSWLPGFYPLRKGDAFVSEKTRRQMIERTNWGSLLDPLKVEPPVPEKERGKWRPPRW